MKRLTFFAMVVATFVAMILAPQRPAQAATTAMTITHTLNRPDGTMTPGAGATFAVYELTPVYHAQTAESGAFATLAHELGAKDEQAIAAYINANHLSRVAEVVTDDTGQAHFNVDGTVGQAYLVVQTAPQTGAGNVMAASQQSLPIVFRLSQADQTQGIALQTKPVLIQRAVYFYKYAQRAEIPLHGAVFALHRTDGLYLGSDGQWRQSPDPRSDPSVLRVSSDEQGLVLLRGIALASGHYEMEEVQAPAGYHLTAASRHVQIQIPQASADAAITVNGAPLRPLLADRVQPGEAERAALRVYNVRPQLPNTGGSQPPQLRQRLPDTGEMKLSLAIVGLLIIGSALLIWRKGKHIWECEQNEK